MKTLRRILLEIAVGIAGGLLYAAAFLLPGGWALVWIALVPWALLFGRPGSRASAWTLAPGAVAFTCAVWWSLLKYGPFFVGTVAADYLFFFGPALALLRATGRLLPRVPIALRLAVIWTGMEFLLVRLDFYRAVSFYLPNPLADWPALIQISDLSGASALAFPVALVNGLCADLILAAWHRRRAGVAATGPTMAGTGEAASFPTPRTLRRTAVLAAALPVLMLVYGFVRIDRSEPKPGPRLALVQPALPHLIGWPLGVEIEEVYQTARDVPPGKADLIIWPENAILDYYDRPLRYLDDLRWLTRSRQAHLLYGAMGRARGNPFRTTNRAMLLSPEGKLEGSYEKIDIIPWAEYYPFESVLSRWAPSLDLLQLRILLASLKYFPTGTAGERMTLFPYEWEGKPLPFSVILCSEGTIAPRSREGAALGASFLVNLISEGEAGPLLQRNMLRVCTLRAVENRRPFVRVGNTGITCTIDESGRLREILKGQITGAAINEPGVLFTSVPLPARPRRALYTRTGDLFAGLCALLAGIAAGGIFFSRRPRQAPPRHGAPSVTALAGLMACALFFAGCRTSPIAQAGEFEPALQRGLKAFQEGHENVALRALQRAAAARPERPEPYRYIAEILRRRKQVFDGYRYFTERRDLGVKNPELYGFLGYFQQAVYRKKEAVESLGKALTADPGQRASLFWLSALLHDSNRHEETFPYLDRYLAIHPTDVEIRRLLAETLVLAGRAGEAEPVLAALVASNPSDAAALRVKGLAALVAGQLEEAAEEMDRAAAADPKTLETRYHQARIAVMRGDLDSARRAIDALHDLEKKGDFD